MPFLLQWDCLSRLLLVPMIATPTSATRRFPKPRFAASLQGWYGAVTWRDLGRLKERSGLCEKAGRGPVSWSLSYWPTWWYLFSLPCKGTKDSQVQQLPAKMGQYAYCSHRLELRLGPSESAVEQRLVALSWILVCMAQTVRFGWVSLEVLLWAILRTVISWTLVESAGAELQGNSGVPLGPLLVGRQIFWSRYCTGMCDFFVDPLADGLGCRLKAKLACILLGTGLLPRAWSLGLSSRYSTGLFSQNSFPVS